MSNYYELLKKQAELNGDKILFYIGKNSYSYADVLNMTNTKAAELSSFSIGAGSAILVIGKGFLDQATGFLAPQKLGIIPILLHHGLKENEIQEIISNNKLQGVWNISEGKFYSSGLEMEKHLSNDVMGALTSGSTGVPKVLYRTYFSWAGFFDTQNKIFLVDENTRIFIHGNLSFTGNLNILASVLYAGGSVISSDRADVNNWLKLIKAHNANAMYLVPAKLNLLERGIDEQLPEIRSIITGSQTLTGDNLKVLMKSLPNCKIYLYYGASELNYITYTVCDDLDRNIENVGKPFPGIKVFIKNGMIYVDTPYHISGIEVPFTLKDMGKFNEKGELLFLGRQVNWINKGGYKISCVRIENTLKGIKGIRDAVVLPIDDRVRGKEIAAYIVKDEDWNTESVRRNIRQQLPKVEMPKIIKFIEKIPLNDRGKVDISML